jgi:hypothetical protein
VDNFEDVQAIKRCMEAAGLIDIKIDPLMFGVANVHVGTKP